MDFATIAALFAVFGSMIGMAVIALKGFYSSYTPEQHVKLMHAKAKRLGVAVAKPGEPYYASTWDAVQQGEETARANVWPEGSPDYTSDLDRRLEPILRRSTDTSERCSDCEYERVGSYGFGKWVLTEPCDAHALWEAPQSYAFNVEHGRTELKKMGTSMADVERNVKEWNQRYRMEDNY